MLNKEGFLGLNWAYPTPLNLVVVALSAVAFVWLLLWGLYGATHWLPWPPAT